MTTPRNLLYLSDRSELWPDSDDERFLEDYKDLWIAVLGRAVDDYRQGIRRDQHKKLGADPVVHRGRRDAEEYRDWLNSAHWLLSDDTRPRSFCWLMKILRLEPDIVRCRMNTPPARGKVASNPTRVDMDWADMEGRD